MKNQFKISWVFFVGALLLAFIPTVLSVYIERVGPEMAVTGNLCGPTHDDLCYEPALKGGFPFAYLYDVPTISVPHRLSFLEDEFKGSWFIADWLTYLLLFVLLYLFIKRTTK